MSDRANKKELHVRVDPAVYEKLRHITFYERQTITYVVNRLIAEYVEDRAIEEPGIITPLFL